METRVPLSLAHVNEAMGGWPGWGRNQFFCGKLKAISRSAWACERLWVKTPRAAKLSLSNACKTVASQN